MAPKFHALISKSIKQLNSQLLQIHSTTDKHSSVHIRWTYIILLAITALLSFPFVISHRFSKSRITITRNLFSCTQEKKGNWCNWCKSIFAKLPTTKNFAFYQCWRFPTLGGHLLWEDKHNNHKTKISNNKKVISWRFKQTLQHQL